MDNIGMWDVKHQFLESVLRDCQTVVNESFLDFKAFVTNKLYQEKLEKKQENKKTQTE